MKKFFTQTVWMLVALLTTVSANAFTTNDISLEIIGISTSTGSFASINEYVSPSGKIFTTNGDIYVSGRFRNNTGSIIEMDASKFKIAFGYGESPYTSQVYSGGGGNITTISVWGHDYTDVIFKIPTNWKWHIKNNTLSLYFIYTISNPIHFFNETYNITTSVAQTKAAIEKESSIAVSYYDASNITVKSTDDSAIKSIRVIGTMGDLVKSQSYGNNCTETNFDLSNCKNGIYYIQVEKTNGVETAKIIKK